MGRARCDSRVLDDSQSSGLRRVRLHRRGVAEDPAASMTWLERAATVPMLAAFAGACGQVLDLGHEDVAAPHYATPETIASEQDAGPGVPTIIASNQYGAIDIAISGTRVYWLEESVNPLVPSAENGVVRS